MSLFIEVLIGLVHFNAVRIYLQLFNWFQLFSSIKENFWKLQDTVRTGQKYTIWKGVSMVSAIF